MVDLSVSVAFFAGVISFFAPCVIPLLPAYVGYVTGVSAKDLKNNGYASYRKKIILSSLIYILGFSLVFVLSGAAVAGVGVFFRRYDFLVQRIGGLIILMLGLEFAGILNFTFLSKTKQFTLPKWSEKLGVARPFILGIIFAAAWTPCVGAVLGSILALAATAGHVLQGAWLLFIYSLGISIPFLIVSLTLASAPKYLKFITRRIDVIAKIAGILLAILGALLLTDTYKYVNSYLFALFETSSWNAFITNRV